VRGVVLYVSRDAAVSRTGEIVVLLFRKLGVMDFDTITQHRVVHSCTPPNTIISVIADNFKETVTSTLTRTVGGGKHVFAVF
jgi:hypothetical protein